jgi:serine/threonine-protein kinase HipA
MRKAKIYFHKTFAGELSETPEGYTFSYSSTYINQEKMYPLSKTLPFNLEGHSSKTLFPFFDGLIPEGWLLDIAEKNWKVNQRDRFGLLLKCCKNCIGAVSVEELIE